ncbi:response regulator transcription factor [Enterococcus sp. LJL51]|uniref:response regulator transcription factor n=1 Tax=Enterococcus sp. LJL51 TaxID=3416656 RepID=UPI003CE8756D
MRKLLIVEDEWIIRKALTSLPWEQIGITEIIEADNGQEGLEKYLKYLPQVVLTDINMPFMDGITMGKEIVKNNCSPSRIIFLTGYSEFSYAQAAISMKAFDYILKPVDASVLLPQVDRAFQAVAEEILTEQTSGEYQRRELIKKVIHSQKADFSRQIDQLFQVAGPYQCLCYFLNKGVLSIPSQFRHETIRLEDNTYFSLVYLEKLGIEFQDWLNASELQKFIKRNEGWIGLSTIGKGSEDVTEKIIEARICFEKNKLAQPGVYTYNPQQARFDFSPILQELEIQLSQAIKAEKPMEVYQKLNSLEENGALLTLPLAQVRPFLIKQVFFLLQTAGSMLQRDEFLIYQKITSGTVLKELLQPVKDLAKAWAEVQEQNTQSDSIIEQAKRFIDLHYADENISLQLVAENTHVSPPYLSNLFKSETGKNYTDYLFERRMTEAYRLLKTTNHSITEISLETGFTNPNYFSSCFKKENGLSPKQFRVSYKKEIEGK